MIHVERANVLANILINGVVPFKKTPANILARGLEYSPLGLMKSLIYDLYQVRNGTMEATQAIDNIAAGMTGTMIVALGYWLASLGMLTGGDRDESDEQRFYELQGGQNYSLRIGDKYFSLDWLAPTSLPLFVGVELFNATEDDGEDWTPAQVFDAFSKISEPMFNMSMLQGINNILSSTQYSEGAPLTAAVGNIAGNYISQGIPTLFGQVARTIDPVRRDPYHTDQDSDFKQFDVFMNQLKAKIPFLNSTLEPYIDEWGRTQPSGGFLENFLSPAYFSDQNITAVDAMIQDIYKQTGDPAVLPDAAGDSARSLRKGGEPYKLTAEEYTQYATARGRTAYSILEQPMNTSAFRGMTAEEKAVAVQDAYRIAGSAARAELGLDMGSDWRCAESVELNRAGISYAQQIAYLYMLADLGTKRIDIILAVERFSGLTKDQRQLLFSATNTRFRNPYEALDLSDFRYTDLLTFRNHLADLDGNETKASLVSSINSMIGLTEKQRYTLFEIGKTGNNWVNPYWEGSYNTVSGSGGYVPSICFIVKPP